MYNVFPIKKVTETSVLILAIVIVTYGVYLRQDEVTTSITRIFSITGLATFVLLPLTLALVTTLLFSWVTPSADRSSIRRTLGIVAALSPIAGFLGTTFGMMEAISALGSAEDIDALLSMVGHSLNGMSEAIASTSWGLLNTIIAVLYLKLKLPSRSSRDVHADAGQTEELLRAIHRMLERIETSQGNVPSAPHAASRMPARVIKENPVAESIINPE